MPDQAKRCSTLPRLLRRGLIREAVVVARTRWASPSLFLILCLSIGLFSHWWFGRQRSAASSSRCQRTMSATLGASWTTERRVGAPRVCAAWCLSRRHNSSAATACFVSEEKKADWMDEWLKINYNKRLKCAQRGFCSYFCILFQTLHSNADDCNMFALSKWGAVTSEGSVSFKRVEAGVLYCLINGGWRPALNHCVLMFAVARPL